MAQCNDDLFFGILSKYLPFFIGLAGWISKSEFHLSSAASMKSDISAEKENLFPSRIPPGGQT